MMEDKENGRKCLENNDLKRVIADGAYDNKENFNTFLK